MKIYKLFEVNNQPTKQLFDREVRFGRIPKYEIFNNDLYFTAEVNVESNLEEEVTDEEFERLVEEELENILETLNEYGRYPEYGIPEYVMV